MAQTERSALPVIHVTLIEGYAEDAKTALCIRLTDAAMAVIDAPAEAVTVAITEVAPAGYMRGRERKVPGKALPAPAALCLDFLDALGKRDLDRARALVAPDFCMVFPGKAEFAEFDSLMAWAAPRYRRIAKRIDRVEEAPLGPAIAVYISGTLEGERPDGTPFSEVRFIDRFEVRGGVISAQEVWNDLAEDGVTG